MGIAQREPVSIFIINIVSLLLFWQSAHPTSIPVDLHEIDTAVLLKALDVLVKRGVAQIFAGTSDPESVGVKFFGIS